MKVHFDKNGKVITVGDRLLWNDADLVAHVEHDVKSDRFFLRTDNGTIEWLSPGRTEKYMFILSRIF